MTGSSATDSMRCGQAILLYRGCGDCIDDVNTPAERSRKKSGAGSENSKAR